MPTQETSQTEMQSNRRTSETEPASRSCETTSSRGTHTTTWTNLRETRLSERSRITEGYVPCDSIWNILEDTHEFCHDRKSACLSWGQGTGRQRLQKARGSFTRGSGFCLATGMVSWVSTNAQT